VVDKNKVSALDLAMKLHKDSEIHKAMSLVGLAWKELRGLNNPTTIAEVHEDAPVVEADYEISILDSSVDPSERPTVRVHAQLSAKVNNFTAEDKRSPVKKAQNGSPVKKAADSVQAYDSPEHIHTRAAESVGKTPSNSVRTGPTNTRATDKVLEHLGRRASELQTQLAQEEKEVSKKQTKSPAKAQSKAEAERRASVLTADEEELLVDVDADGDLVVEDAHLLEITGAPLTFSSPVCVPHHTPVAHAPPVHNKGFSFTDGSTKVTGAGDAGISPAVSSSNSANVNNIATIATPTGSAAIAQASSLYRTGSFKSPVLPKKELSTDKTPIVRKSSIKSDAGSFKSPYMGTSAKKTINVIPENTAESTADAQVGAANLEPPAIQDSTEIDVPVDNGASTNDEGFSTPSKPSATMISEVSAAPVDSTPTHSSTNATTITGAQTAMKASSVSVTTNPAVSQTAFAPRRPSAGPNQSENNRPNVRSARYNALQKANSSSNNANKTATAGESGKAASEVAASLKGIPKNELITPVAPSAGTGTDGSGEKLRHIIASPPAKSVAEAKPFRRGSSVKKAAPSADNSKK